MDNILIKFTADDSGFDEVNKKLLETKKTGEGLTNEMKKTTAEFSNTKKAADDSAKSQSSSHNEQKKATQQLKTEAIEAAKSIETLHSALDKVSTENPFQQLVMFSQQMGEGIADSVLRSGIDMDSLRAKTAGVESEFEAFSIVVDAMEQKLAEMEKAGEQSSDMYQELAAAVDYASGMLAIMGDEVEDNGKKTKKSGDEQQKSFRTIRREIEEQIKTMEMLGDTGSEEYQRLVEKAGELNDIQGDVTRSIQNMASDTRAFDTILEGAQGVAGSFSVAQGVMALFGSESEDVQKMMVKLQAAIAITTGLQQIQNLVQKESNIMMGVSIIQTKAKMTAELLATKGTIAATIAQKAFNVVAMANPYVLMAVALITVVGALALFALGSRQAEREQKSLNAEIANTNKQITAIKNNSDFDVSIAEAAGNSREEIFKMRLEAAKAANELAYLKMNQVMANKNASKEQRDEAIRMEKETYDNVKKILDEQTVYTVKKRTEAAQKGNEAAKKALEERAEREKKAEQDLLDAKLSSMKAGENKEIEAVRLSLKRRLDEIKGSSQAEIDLRKQLEENANTEIDKIRNKYAKDRKTSELETELAIINSRLTLSEKGSLAEYNLKIAQLNKQAELDRLAVENSSDSEELKAAKILEINANLNADLNGLDDDLLKQEDERRKNQLEAEKEYAAVRKELYQDLISSSMDLFSDFWGFLYEGEAQRYEKQIENLQKYYTIDVEEAKKNKDLKLISAEEFARKEEELENKKKAAERKGKRANLFMSQAEALGKIW